MNHQKYSRAIAVFIFLAIIIMGCDNTQPTPSPTMIPTPLSASVSPALPTPARAVPALTPTPIILPATTPTPSAAAGSDAETLVNALLRVKTATRYRFEVTIIGRGALTVGRSITSESGSEPKEVILVSLQGAIRDQDAHLVISRPTFLTANPDRPLEVIHVGGKSYLKGPLPLVGANQDTWYELAPQMSNPVQPALLPGQVLDLFGAEGLDPADLKRGSESLDGQSCDVYSGDTSALLRALNRLENATGATPNLDSIDRTEFMLWVCEDGYIHQVRLLIEGHDKSDQKGSYQVLIKLSDWNGDIQITPPVDAQPLDGPFANPTATP